MVVMMVVMVVPVARVGHILLRLLVMMMRLLVVDVRSGRVCGRVQQRIVFIIRHGRRRGNHFRRRGLRMDFFCFSLRRTPQELGICGKYLGVAFEGTVGADPGSRSPFGRTNRRMFLKMVGALRGGGLKRKADPEHRDEGWSGRNGSEAPWKANSEGSSQELYRTVSRKSAGNRTKSK
ncbi:hypothetical protein BDZ88DRAFT_406522 [Geranomyces variabilis]|nr:hypothetical protein BDZ88DRAFT_406522 [Geranomyces variabilis]